MSDGNIQCEWDHDPHGSHNGDSVELFLKVRKNIRIVSCVVFGGGLEKCLEDMLLQCAPMLIVSCLYSPHI